MDGDSQHGWLARRFSRITSGGKYIPVVDGLRFLAIAGVLLFHLEGFIAHNSQAKASGTFEQAVQAMLGAGDLGVPMFFLLSGFILSLPIVSGAKSLRLKKYFLRRATRLEPPYLLASLGVFGGWLLLKGTEGGMEQLPHALAGLVYLHGPVYGELYRPNPVIWSLEIEVQFYLLFPLLALLFRWNAWPRRGVLSLGVCAFAALDFFVGWRFPHLLGHFHYFLAGMLLADINPQVGDSEGHAGWDFGAGALAIAGWWWFVSLDGDRAPFVIWAFAMYVCAFRSRWFGRALGSRGVRTVGMMCYTIYLLHFPLIAFFGRFTLGFGAGLDYLPRLALQSLIIALPVLLVCAVFFALIEQPCMDPKWAQKLWARFRRAP